MKTQCPHCNQEYDVDDQNNGEIVTCEACSQEFVIEPIPEGDDNAPPEAVPEVVRKAEPVMAPRPTPEPVPEAIPEAVPEAAANPNMMFCRNCGKQIAREAVICPNCGTKYGPVGEDKLSGGTILILWLLLLVPFGGILVVFVSSILYYVWKGSYPKKAKAVNLHGWLVFLVSILLWIILFRMH